MTSNPGLRALANSRYLFWLLLALPSIPMFSALSGGAADSEGRHATEYLLEPSGERAAQFMILAMMITPLRMLFPKSNVLRWVAVRRRYLGVAAFAYGTLHTALYAVDMGSLEAVLGEFFILGIWTGWLAFFIFLPLALTSNDISVRLMGPNWKKLQRLVYAAAVATLVHWIFVHNQIAPALVHFLPLAALEAWRIRRTFTRRASSLATSQVP